MWVENAVGNRKFLEKSYVFFSSNYQKSCGIQIEPNISKTHQNLIFFTQRVIETYFEEVELIQSTQCCFSRFSEIGGVANPKIFFFLNGLKMNFKHFFWGGKNFSKGGPPRFFNLPWANFQKKIQKIQKKRVFFCLCVCGDISIPQV